MDHQKTLRYLCRPFTALLLAAMLLGSLITPAFAASDEITVTLDGVKMYPGTYSNTLAAAELKNDRTMVPIRFLAEGMGATVSWNEATSQVTISRADDLIVLTIDSNIAICNGKELQMDVAPYISGERTLLPTRYIAEFFGQKVDWDEASLTVSVTEDKSLVGASNLEQWALPMGAMLNRMNNFASPARFGGLQRFTDNQVWGYEYGRYVLKNSWSINDRDELIKSVASMTDAGHNKSFEEYADFIAGMSAAEFDALLAESAASDKEMFLYTKAIMDKWGNKGILCWDLFRMSNLVQWGYLAGYLTYPEALALLEPAATKLQQTFGSWDEAYENYLEGYLWWARTPAEGSVWDTERGKIYKEMKADAELGKLFDDALFKTPVNGIDASAE